MIGTYGTQIGTIERLVKIPGTEYWNPKEQCLLVMIHYALLLWKDKTVVFIFNQVIEWVVIVGMSLYNLWM